MLSIYMKGGDSMNQNEPDKFEQFMTSVRESGKTIGEGLHWLTLHVEEVAFMTAVPIVALTILLVARAQARRRNPKVSGMRHARR